MIDNVRTFDSASKVARPDPVAVGVFMDALTGRREPTPDERDAELLAEVLYERLGRAAGSPAWADLPERSPSRRGGPPRRSAVLALGGDGRDP